MLSKNISPIFIILLVVISLYIIIYIISKIECNLYKISTYDIYTDKIDDKVCIVYLSDFHNKKNKKYINDLINDILSINPDYIVLGGDFVVFSSLENILNTTKVDAAIDFIEKLSNKLGKSNKNNNYNLSRIFFGFGNHELRLMKRNDNGFLTSEYDKFIKCLSDNNVNVLDNNLFNISENKTISGLSLYDGYYTNVTGNEKRKTNIDNSILDPYFKNIDKNKYNVMVFHNPAYCEDLLNYGFDMVLSGHNHGGLIKFPIIGSVISPDMQILPKYNNGLYEVRGKHVIVSSGIGEHFVKIRVNNRPEMCVININGTDNLQIR